MSHPTSPDDTPADQPYTGPAYGDRTYPGQGQPGQGQPVQGQPGQDQAGQPYPGQAYPGQQYPGQAYPGQAYGAQGYYQPPARRYNTMAIVAVICGGLGLTALPFIASVAAIITGHMARREIARTGEDGNALALIGLILGYVVVGGAILAVGAWLLFVLGFGAFGLFGASMG